MKARTLAALAAVGILVGAGTPRAQPTVRPAVDSTFARLVQQLSEPAGYFDSDNIISNETSYLHVLDALKRLGVQSGGGVYVGVGPDQNFSYIAAIHPSLAFIIDIRRDNLLEHLLFKALFARARHRVEYLALLTGKALPANADAWSRRSLADIIAFIDSAHVDPAPAAVRRVIDSTIVSFGVPLSPEDRATIERYRTAFVTGGLDVRFSSLGRNNALNYPTLRRMLLETDRGGRQASYLASEEAFQFVKGMQQADRVVPVVGDVAGLKALPAIASYIAARHERVTAFYISNVEQYLMRDGTFGRFAQNMKLLPRDERTVIIRSVFAAGRFGGVHPLWMPGYNSASLL
jgi:hypothetical protein